MPFSHGPFSGTFRESQRPFPYARHRYARDASASGEIKQNRDSRTTFTGDVYRRGSVFLKTAIVLHVYAGESRITPINRHIQYVRTRAIGVYGANTWH